MRNFRFDIYRYVQSEDDEVGGSVQTGSCIYPFVVGDIQDERDALTLQRWGGQYRQIYRAVVMPSSLYIEPDDELVLLHPQNTRLYSGTFQVLDVHYSDYEFQDRGQVILTCARIDYMRNNQRL